MNHHQPTNPEHVSGTMRGESMVLDKGREPGRKTGRRQYRSARDSTGICAKSREPIDPRMPNIPPA